MTIQREFVCKGPLNAPPTARLRIAVRGAVQGVGFRPFVHRLASALGLTGWVNNSNQGVLIDVEGPRASLEQFLSRLRTENPPRSFIQSLESRWLEATGCAGFEIRASESAGARLAIIMPDLATCPECVREIFDPRNRRHLYPFTNCTHCGPRFSIVESLPYDRPNTAMRKFILCPECEREYHDPADRRFHAQPNACPKCGPHLELWNTGGAVLSTHHTALLQAAEIIRDGRILALKGIGGFQLLVAARNEEAVRRLRERKQREEKPLAVMYPSLEAVRADCRVTEPEARLLLSPESPIVLLRCVAPPAPSVAPGNPHLGVMLPGSPLHHLLIAELQIPVVATSGNLTDEPICIDEREALPRLRHIADAFLVHNRPIVRHVDDSVVRVILGREQILRRARGYAPLPLPLTAGRPAAFDFTSPILAVGAHLKNTVALGIGGQVFVSQHIGDLETLESYEAFLRVTRDFQKIYDAAPQLIASDQHPDYLSTQFAASLVARQLGPRSLAVQHHVAHVLACAAENELAPPLLGVSWDGTGFGSDGTIWGGEFFLLTSKSCRRVAHFRQFRLPGGEAAIHEPRRAALGVLYELFGETGMMKYGLPLREISGPSMTPGGHPRFRGAHAPRVPQSAPSPTASLSPGNFDDPALKDLAIMLQRGINSPLTSSVGRLFDAVAALLGIRQIVRFEGQAAMELEFAIGDVKTDESYSFRLDSKDDTQGGSLLVVDWEPTFASILADIKREVPAALISARFHNTLAETIVAVAKRTGQSQLALSGGCFQNRYLTERAVFRLTEEGFRPSWPQRFPPNDGGIALGQIVAAMMDVE